MQGVRFRVSPNATISYKNDGKYAEGVAEGPIKLVLGEKLRKAVPELNLLKPDGPDKSWAQ